MSTKRNSCSPMLSKFVFFAAMLAQTAFGGVEYQSSDVPKSISDFGTVVSVLDILDSGQVIDINIRLDITHSYDADLEVFLVGPDSTRVELFSDVGDSDANFSETILDDQALTYITSGSAPFTGSYRPEGILADFEGRDMAGMWLLEITDDAAGDTGTLNSWSLIIETPVPEDIPSVAAVTPEADSTIKTAYININVIFSEPVTGVDETDMVLSGTAADVAFVEALTQIDSNSWSFPVYDLADGVLNVSLAADVNDIEDADGNDLRPCPTYWSYIVNICPAGDFDYDYDVDFNDFRIFASAWLSESGTGNWNQACDISESPDNIIDEDDMAVFTGNWLFTKPESNNECGGAVAILLDDVIMGTTFDADGNDITSCGNNDKRDVWFKFTPETDGIYTISLLGSSFDTTLAVFDGCGGNELACNDDIEGTLQSEITVNLNALTSYYIRIAGFDNTVGDYILTVSGN